jgi:acetyltransferase-like isoleucine patch superfamily enzyme
MKRILLKFIPTILKKCIRKNKIEKKFNISLGNNCIVDNSSFFEGNNAVYNNSEISESFIGYGTYIANNSIIRKAKIGRYCAIGDNVRTSLGKHPSNYFVSIHPAFFSIQKQAGFTYVNEQKFEEHKFIDEEKKYVTQIGNDVWIGNNVSILDGVEIENGAIIGTGALVTKNVPAYSVVIGVPAKVNRFRFSIKEIEYLIDLKWWEKDNTWIKKHAKYFNDIKTLMQITLQEYE